MPAKQVRGLFVAFDTDGNGRVAVGELADLLFPATPAQVKAAVAKAVRAARAAAKAATKAAAEAGKAPKARVHKAPSAIDADPVQFLRKEIQARKMRRRHFVSTLDRSNDGQLQLQELQRGLRDLRVSCLVMCRALCCGLCCALLGRVCVRSRRAPRK